MDLHSRATDGSIGVCTPEDTIARANEGMLWLNPRCRFIIRLGHGANAIDDWLSRG
jgi:hypothetical protein